LRCELHGVLYCNDGDWVESCTALVERHDGSLELIWWSDRRNWLAPADNEAEDTSTAA